MTAFWGIVAAIGVLAFVTTSDWPRAWSIYLVNLVFWGALAVTGPAVAGMMQLTEARWSPTVRRLAITTIGFLPVAFVLLVLLFAGRATLYPWVTTPVPVKAAWLNVPFFFGRTLVLAAVLFLLCYAFARALLRDPIPADDEIERVRRNRLATLVLMLWLITISLWGFDLIMALDPIWYSGLFGGYFAVSALYTTFCLLSILTIRANARGLATVPPAAVQDVAKLQFAMSIMWMYFFWSQYLVIWYGNVPIETRFVVARFFEDPYRALALAAFFLGWLIPFAYLLGRLTGRPPESHRVLIGICCLSLLAIFLERIVLVFPSVSIGHVGLGSVVVGLLVTAGFGALFALSFLVFVPRLGLVSPIEG
jgi:hypothetical protein